MAGPVLLISHSGDTETVDLVAKALARRGAPAFAFLTDRFPEHLRLDVSQPPGRPGRFLLADRGRTIDLARVESVWLRRIAEPALGRVDPTYLVHCRRESRTLLEALFATLRSARWIDPVARVALAAHKLLQLDVARRLGLETPATLTTNDPEAVRKFYDEHSGRVVTRMLHSHALLEGGAELEVFDTSVEPEDLEALADLKHCPMVFQERLPRQAELRAVVVADRLFVVSARPAGPEDRRHVGPGRAGEFRRDALPADVEPLLLQLVKSYGLVYASIDMIRTEEGKHVFVEMSASEDWGWLDARLGLPIAEELAGVLAGEVDAGRRHPELY